MSLYLDRDISLHAYCQGYYIEWFQRILIYYNGYYINDNDNNMDNDLLFVNVYIGTYWYKVKIYIMIKHQITIILWDNIIQIKLN